jgi:hypothetical protein
LTVAHPPPKQLRNLKPIDRCIYCARIEGLTREHVIPFGMGGEIVLARASCRRCSQITQTIEEHCLRDTLIEVRAKHKLKSRNPGARPVAFPVEFTYLDGRTSTEMVGVDDYPMSWVMPIFGVPQVLSAQRRDDHLGVLHAQSDSETQAAFNRLLARPGVHTVSATTGGVNIGLFARWIAKMAYCYAIASNSDIVGQSDCRIRPHWH